MTVSVSSIKAQREAAKEAKKFALLMTPLCIGLLFTATHYSFAFMNSNAPALAGVFGAMAIISVAALGYVYELTRKAPVPVTA